MLVHNPPPTICQITTLMFLLCYGSGGSYSKEAEPICDTPHSPSSPKFRKEMCSTTLFLWWAQEKQLIFTSFSDLFCFVLFCHLLVMTEGNFQALFTSQQNPEFSSYPIFDSISDSYNFLYVNIVSEQLSVVSSL